MLTVGETLLWETFQRQSCWAHPCPWRTHHSKHLFVIYYIYTQTQWDVKEAEEWEDNQLRHILKLCKCALCSNVGFEQSKLRATLFIVVTTFYCSVSHRLLPVGMHYYRGRLFSIQFIDIKAKCPMLQTFNRCYTFPVFPNTRHISAWCSLLTFNQE